MLRIKFRSLMKENEREAQIQRALKALESGKYTTLGEAATAFKVPNQLLATEERAARLDVKHTKKSNYSPLLVRKP